MKSLTLTFITVVLTCLSAPAMADSKRTSASKADLKKLLAKRNLLAVPSISSQVASTSAKEIGVQSEDPPTLQSIPNLPIKDIFWRKINGVNVIDGINSGSADPAFCSEFFNGDQDGESGGLAACHMAESVGYSFSRILQSETSLCYMKNFPTKKNLNSGGITINSGTLPSGGITQLFSTPNGNVPRVVKVNVSGTPPGAEEETGSPGKIFLQIASKNENKTAGNLYAATLWFCDAEEIAVRGYDKITISKNMVFTAEHANDDEFADISCTSQGYLIPSGNNLKWNSARSRTSSTMFQTEMGDQFKSQFEITSNNLIKLQRSDSFSGNAGKGYIITKYSGKTAEDLRFLSGAHKNLHFDNSVVSATDYEGTYYQVDTGSSYLDDAEAVDFNAGFYSEDLGFEVDLSPYSCATVPDIELTMDISNTTLESSIRECGQGNLRNMHFCHDDQEVQMAEARFRQVCLGAGSPGSGPPNGP